MNATKIELLEALSENPENDTFIAKDSTLEQRIALIELEEESLIECKYRTDEKGKPSDFWNMRLTSSGRDVLAEIQNPPKKKTNWSMIGGLSAFGAFVAVSLIYFLSR
jgi:hypothetical protein